MSNSDRRVLAGIKITITEMFCWNSKETIWNELFFNEEVLIDNCIQVQWSWVSNNHRSQLHGTISNEELWWVRRFVFKRGSNNNESKLARMCYSKYWKDNESLEEFGQTRNGTWVKYDSEKHCVVCYTFIPKS